MKEIKMKLKLCILHLFIVIPFLTILSLNANAQTQKPNIIFILADDVGYNTPGFNGNTSYSTPNLDVMAAQGMRFTGCRACPRCTPSRIQLLTGKYNFRNYTQWGVMDQSQKTFVNMLKDSGYKTAIYGKWQLDGGDQSLRTFGFNTYSMHGPFYKNQGSRYKNPHIYQNGDYVPDALTLNKYGEDIFTDSVLNFIDSNKSVPFIVYYPMVLSHEPFSPTPNDPEFATWDPTQSDTSFYPSMINYMDQKIGMIINKVKSLGLENKTIIIFTGDNGTPGRVSEIGNDNDSTLGGKGTTTEAGTRVPLVVYWPNTVQAGSVNNDLIDFTDFFPTIANVANIPLPTSYGPLDGVSFAPRLKNQIGAPRQWIFDHNDPKFGNDIFQRFAQTSTYKLYDTSSISTDRLFYNLVNDVKEVNPIPNSSLTPQESLIKQQLLNVINGYALQCVPLIFSSPTILILTDSSCTTRNTINSNAGASITASGIVWSTSPDPTILTGNISSNLTTIETFTNTIKGLNAATKYYAKAFASNKNGTSYGKEISFTTNLKAPVATPATLIDTTSFLANWNKYNNTDSYKLDVSTSPTFSNTSSTFNLTEGFNNGTTPPTGWQISKAIITNTTLFGSSTPSLQFKKTNDQVVTKSLSGPASQLSFWIMGLGSDSASALLVEGFDGKLWSTIERISKLPNKPSSLIKTYNSTSTPALQNKFTRFRFTYFKSVGMLLFDDVSINYALISSSFVNGYENLKVRTNSKLVTGLSPGVNYYYRVKSYNDSNYSGFSNIITAKTLGTNNIIPSNPPSEQKVSLFVVNAIPNPTNNEFTLSIQSSMKDRIEISVFDINNKSMYHTTGFNQNKYTFGSTFPFGNYLVMVRQGENTKTLKLIKIH